MVIEFSLLLQLWLPLCLQWPLSLFYLSPESQPEVEIYHRFLHHCNRSLSVFSACLLNSWHSAADPSGLWSTGWKLQHHFAVLKVSTKSCVILQHYEKIEWWWLSSWSWRSFHHCQQDRTRVRSYSLCMCYLHILPVRLLSVCLPTVFVRLEG